MNLRRTLTAAIVFAIALGAYHIDRLRVAAAEARRTQATRLIPTPAESISRISIVRDGSDLVLQRTGGEWRLTEPVQAAADPQTVADLIYFLDRQERIGPMAVPAEALAEYGLAHPPVTATIESEGGGSVGIAIGFETPVFGQVYARLADRDEYFTVAADLKDYLTRPAYAYRDKTLLARNATEATTLTLTFEGTLIEAAREEDGWWLNEPIRARADDRAIEDILREILMTQAEDFIDTATLDLIPYGLEVPSLVAMVDWPPAAEGDAPERGVLTLGYRRPTDPPSFYAVRQDRPTVFSVPYQLESRLRPDLASLRSRRAFTMASSDVGTFGLEFGYKDMNRETIILRRDSAGRWQFEDFDYEVDQAAASRIVETLVTTTVERYFPAQQDEIDETGLEDSLVRAWVTDRAGERTEGMETGGPAPGGYYARLTPSGEIVAIPASRPGRFFKRLDNFRDKTLFAFAPTLVKSILVEQRGARILFRPGDFGWEREIEGSGQPKSQVQATIISGLTRRLLALRWSRALDPALPSGRRAIADQGLESPWRRIVFMDEAGQPLADLRQGATSGDNVYLQRGEDEFFAVEGYLYEVFQNTLEILLPRA